MSGKSKKVAAAGRGPFLFPTYLGRSKGPCSQGSSREKLNRVHFVFQNLAFYCESMRTICRRLSSKFTSFSKIWSDGDQKQSLNTVLQCIDKNQTSIPIEHLSCPKAGGCVIVFFSDALHRAILIVFLLNLGFSSSLKCFATSHVRVP